MASFRSEAEAFLGMSGMAEGHDRYARGLKPRALARGVVHFFDMMVPSPSPLPAGERDGVRGDFAESNEI
ncbi:MAG TPA: hypothetical protein VJ462_04320 [Thermodesulfobacteriota bacterium]|jgi:hypothetical protein|nr:hypothetical protein [Thermodesulfobacteriota bacterium]